MTATQVPTSRQQNRIDTEARIVDAARGLLAAGDEVTLRAVARELGLTAPALYRYAASHEDLMRMIAIAIDSEVADRIAAAAAGQPADDPAAQLIAACVEFRRWALGHRKEFALIFANVDVECIKEHEGSSGMVFSGLLVALWAAYRFPVPVLADLEPGLAAILEVPDAPVDPAMKGDLAGLVWTLTQGWSRLYGTVTLEVFGHVDARLVEEGYLFRSMIADQAESLGLAPELDRLQDLIGVLLAA
ncbi:MAG: TetR/AcrR family transcriptional regulator [Marmoricola sp.]